MNKPSHLAARIISEEHDRLAAVLHGMQYLVRAIESEGKSKSLDFKVFRAMLLYISEYPERVHHPKEDRLLFSRLRQRTHELDARLAELERQHAAGERLVRELEHALNRYELEGASAFPALRDLVEEYARFYYSHMRIEEDEILPAARQLLAPEDLAVIDAGFAENRDPLNGMDSRDNFEKLFSLIVNIAPAPIGLGNAL